MRTAFIQVICFEYYDGPTQGVARDENARRTIFFDLMAWTGDQNHRIFKVHSIDPSLFENLGLVFQLAGERPRKRIWAPRWESLDQSSRKKADRLVKLCKQRRKDPAYLVADAGFLKATYFSEAPSKE